MNGEFVAATAGIRENRQEMIFSDATFFAIAGLIS
jgi:hypothetical protein